MCAAQRHGRKPVHRVVVGTSTTDVAGPKRNGRVRATHVWSKWHGELLARDRRAWLEVGMEGDRDRLTEGSDQVARPLERSEHGSHE